MKNPAFLVVALAASLPAAEGDLQRKFAGAWDLVSYELRSPSGEVTQPLGTGPAGRISYDSAGRMSAHLMRRGVPKFASENRTHATADEMTAAWRGYAGYFGRYTIDQRKGVVIHQVEGAWFPNFVGSKQVRAYRFEGEDRLILQADEPRGHTTITWKRSR